MEITDIRVFGSLNNFIAAISATPPSGLPLLRWRMFFLSYSKREPAELFIEKRKARWLGQLKLEKE